MSDRPDDESAGAIPRRLADEVTGAIAAAEERGRRFERRHTGHTPPVISVPQTGTSEHVREIAEKVFDEKLPQHKLDCMQPGGGLHELGQKVDQLRVTDIKGKVLVSLLVVLIPLGIAWWNNSKSNERLQKQIETAADVAKQLKIVQDVAKSQGTLEADVPMTKGPLP
jgi:hypothetical protein